MKRAKILTLLLVVVLMLTLSFFTVGAVFAEGEGGEGEQTGEAVVETGSENDLVVAKAVTAAAIVGVVAAIGAFAMGWAITKSTDGMARQPEASSKINSAMMLGLVFIETLVIYALIVAILIIFVL